MNSKSICLLIGFACALLQSVAASEGEPSNSCFYCSAHGGVVLPTDGPRFYTLTFEEAQTSTKTLGLVE